MTDKNELCIWTDGEGRFDSFQDCYAVVEPSGALTIHQNTVSEYQVRKSAPVAGYAPGQWQTFETTEAVPDDQGPVAVQPVWRKMPAYMAAAMVGGLNNADGHDPEAEKLTPMKFPLKPYTPPYWGAAISVTGVAVDRDCDEFVFIYPGGSRTLKGDTTVEVYMDSEMGEPV